ncbi:serine hydrolase domain-containing protein [Streptomyces sp. CA-294286]|uniref:serine hydrolase domain-containing protein n=1 Tax=Streptomyces sp. CA-294286 TaxID=3240070 RepID=UPI003D8BF783
MSGDPELAERVRRVAGAADSYHTLSVALLDADGMRFAGLGTDRADAWGPATADTAFEIGSVTKVLTGMLLAARVDAGAVSLEQPVSTLSAGRGFVHAETASVTLEELASHRSGLPRLHRRAPVLGDLRDALTILRGRDPYRGLGVENFLAGARAVAPAGPRGSFAYSNLGMALLGHVLAEAAGGPAASRYPALLERELLAPLGMASTWVREDPADPLTASCAVPHARDGRAVAPWVSAGYAPAGVGVWSTARDLARLLAALLDGSAPGAAAALPRHAADGPNRIGLGWTTLDRNGEEMTWHNGATGGSRSFVGFHRARGCAVAVLSNTDHDVDVLGARLVFGDA